MKNIFAKLSLLMFCLCLVGMSAQALPVKVPASKKTTSQPQKKDGVESCRRAQGSAELSVNNVRVRINQGGNMWTDGATAQYFVPKDGNSTALYCSALWIGGMDENDQLRVAAMRFGADGQDFWPGPLTVDNNASVNKTVCDKWDKLYRMTKAEVQSFVDHFQWSDPVNKTGFLGVDEEYLTSAIKEWPGNGDETLGQSRFLAPFYDMNGDGKYEPRDGDYPYYDFRGALCPTTMKDSLPAGVPYTPVPTYESKNEGVYETGGKMKAYNGLLVDQVLKGDETLWWIFNDKGNAHTESKSQYPIGLEIRAQAFGFTMNNEINSMTFYSYEIINRSLFTLKETYFSQWVDPDLGYAFDDYVGCDVERGLGYCYNGKDIDGPGQGAYSGNPPAVGIDFFQGPYMDPKYSQDIPKVDITAFLRIWGEAELAKYQAQIDALSPEDRAKADINVLLAENANKYKLAWFPDNGNEDFACAINGVNFGNGIAKDERFGMRRFIYYNGTSEDNGEPTRAAHYYNYLRGIWKNGQYMYYGGNGFNTYDGYSEGKGVRSDFMFPGDSDIWGWGTPEDRAYGATNRWDEKNANKTSESGANPVGDRRFMQSAGPFTLEPGAVNYITVGIPFAQATSGGADASVALLRTIDDKCQALFDNCFNVLEGPDAPNLVVQELDREIILYLTNETGNNVNESYAMQDISIPSDYKEEQRKYIFEGYQIFQLKDATVSVQDIDDETKAKLIFQCDIENYDSSGQAIGTLVNYTVEDGYLKSQVMVSGANKGIQHSFRVTEDMFATGRDKRIVNNQKYYYIAVAYAYNNFKQYSPTDPERLDGQKEPYLRSRKKGDGSSIESVTAIPHSLSALNNGTVINTTYGVSPEITRVEGLGNGGLVLNLKKTSVESLMGTKGNEPPTVNGKPLNFIQEPEYMVNAGPLDVKVIDPLNVKAGTYFISFIPKMDTTVDASGNMVVTPDTLDMSKAHWMLTTTPGAHLYDDVDTIISQRALSDVNEELIFGLGISISLKDADPIASKILPSGVTYGNEFDSRVDGNVLAEGSLLYSAISYENESTPWLTGYPDGSTFDWIRSGTDFDDNSDQDIRASYYSIEDYLKLTQKSDTANDGTIRVYDTLLPDTRKVALDAKKEYESCVSGTWAPYRLTSTLDEHPAFSRYYYRARGENVSEKSRNGLFDNGLLFNDMNNLSSVDIVFTSDKSKWTKCPVIEMGSDTMTTENHARKFMLRLHSSWNLDGSYSTDPNDLGMSYFPGYAINLETGERLNMIFGENSSMPSYNGADMMWNPDYNLLGNAMHYVYVLGTGTHLYPTFSGNVNNYVSFPAYDEGETAMKILKRLKDVRNVNSEESKAIFYEVEKLFSSVMWVGTPAASGVFEHGKDIPNSVKDPSLIPTDATVQIRVRKPYAINWSQSGLASLTPMNNNYPMYRFGMTSDMIPAVNVGYAKESILDEIAVVPNPYYASSLYEGDQVANIVRITNLPPDCYITIYSVDGTVIRKLRGPSSDLRAGGGTALTSVNWDLKNERGLQISGGIYLIHVKADGIGEKLVKWFGALRPVDLNSFQ